MAAVLGKSSNSKYSKLSNGNISSSSSSTSDSGYDQPVRHARIQNVSSGVCMCVCGEVIQGQRS